MFVFKWGQKDYTSLWFWEIIIIVLYKDTSKKKTILIKITYKTKKIVAGVFKWGQKAYISLWFWEIIFLLYRVKSKKTILKKITWENKIMVAFVFKWGQKGYSFPVILRDHFFCITSSQTKSFWKKLKWTVCIFLGNCKKGLKFSKKFSKMTVLFSSHDKKYLKTTFNCGGDFSNKKKLPILVLFLLLFFVA